MAVLLTTPSLTYRASDHCLKVLNKLNRLQYKKAINHID